VQEMQKMGQDIEKVTLAKGLQYHLYHFFRILHSAVNRLTFSIRHYYLNTLYCKIKSGEGPIIEQDVLRVSHSDSVQEMQKMGQDIEKVTLAKGLQ
jgi:formyltetrahydrofolate hydrolase